MWYNGEDQKDLWARAFLYSEMALLLKESCKGFFEIRGFQLQSQVLQEDLHLFKECLLPKSIVKEEYTGKFTTH